jgi:hypothetical protein
MTDILAGIGGLAQGVFSGNQIPQRQIGVSIQLAQNTQTGQPSTFSGLGSSGGGLGGLLSGGLSNIPGLIMGGAGGNTINILGLRVSAHIRNAGAQPTADCRIWGLPQSVMNQLNSLGLRQNVLAGNILTISAGSTGTNALSPVFKGYIFQAFADYESMPDVPLVIQAGPGWNVLGSSPTAFPQGFSVVEAMTQIANKMGMQINNAGNVSVQLPSMYLSGSPLQQIRKLARAAGITFGFNPNGKLDLFQKATPRTDTQAITISKQTGMIASPAFSSNCIVVKALFNPAVTQNCTMIIHSNVLSNIAAAFPGTATTFSPVSSQWQVIVIDLDLESLVPKGQWMMTLTGWPSGTNPVLATNTK